VQGQGYFEIHFAVVWEFVLRSSAVHRDLPLRSPHKRRQDALDQHFKKNQFQNLTLWRVPKHTTLCAFRLWSVYQSFQFSFW